MATIAQVAARAGVSTATVSRAINGTARVNPDTNHRVTRAVRDLHYTPSAKAVALAKGERTMLAALAPVGLPNSLMGPLVAHASMVAPDVSFTSVVSRPHLDAELRRLAGDDRIAAVLSVCMAPRPNQAQWFASGKPALIASGARVAGGSFVARDERAAGRLAAEFLLDRGHRSIAFVAGDPVISPYADPSVDRLLGYSESLRTTRSRISCVVRHAVDRASATKVLRRLMRRSRPPTGVVAATANVALQLTLAGVQFLGLETVTFDDSPEPERLGLTAVGGARPWPVALDMVSHAISCSQWAPVEAHISPVLVERQPT